MTSVQQQNKTTQFKDGESPAVVQAPASVPGQVSRTSTTNQPTFSNINEQTFDQHPHNPNDDWQDNIPYLTEKTPDELDQHPHNQHNDDCDLTDHFAFIFDFINPRSLIQTYASVCQLPSHVAFVAEHSLTPPQCADIYTKVRDLTCEAQLGPLDPSAQIQLGGVGVIAKNGVQFHFQKTKTWTI